MDSNSISVPVYVNMIAGLNSPLQSRSEKTLAKILDSTEQLLETRSFEEISVAEIVRNASCSNGSFYARFRDKASLLPSLYERYDAELRINLEDWFKQCSDSRLSLNEICKNCVDEIANMFSSKKWLMRAVAIYARTHAESVPADAKRHRSEFLNRMAQVFLLKSNEINHPEPERAVRNGIFVVAAAMRDAILFGESPHALSSALEFESLKRDMSNMFYACLTMPK